MPSLMESIISLDVGAQEPWPNDVQLFQPYPMEQILLPDNANCLATQAYLHMCGLPFKIEHRANAEFMSPSGKVPFIKCGAFVVSELEPIVQFVANKGISLTQDFDNEQKSDLRAYMSLIFSVLMNAELYICWCDKRTYNEVTKVRNGSVYPWPLNHYQNWTKRSAVIKKLKLLNWYQKTLGSVYQEVETCCQALSERLEGKEYFFGSKPTEVDALVYGHTYSIFSNPVDFPNLFVIFQRFPNLIIHCRRISFNYTFLRYIDFTKTDTDIESSRDSSTHSLLERTETCIFTQLWNYMTLNMYNEESNDVDNSNSIQCEHENKPSENCENIAQVNNNNYEFNFKRKVDPYIQLKPKFEEDESPKSINYLGHKVIQQHLQQDLRNKLSDFTIDTNSDLWSEKDICYISDRDLIQRNINKVDVFELDADDDTNKQIITNLDTNYTHCSGSNSTISNISEQLDWIHDSSLSTIDMNYSNNKCNMDSYTENKNDTVDEQDNIEIDVDNKSNFHNNELDWSIDCMLSTKVDDTHQNNEIIQDIKTTFDSSNMDEAAKNTLVSKCSNCSIYDDLDWLHDFTEDHRMEKGDCLSYDKKHIKDSLDLNESNEICGDKPSKMVLIVDGDIDSNVSKQCSTSNAWTTFESASVSGDNLAIDNMDSTLVLMNDMISSVEQMTGYTSNEITEDTKLENYSDNHICNEYCDNIFIVNDDSFWDDDISKSISEYEKSAKCCANEQNSNHVLNDNNNNNNKILEKKHSDIEITCQNKVIEKISNESLKKYFSCESYRQVGHVENFVKSECAQSDSRSSIIEEYPADKLSNIIIEVNQAYPENEFLKLLKSDYDITQSESNVRCDSTFLLHNCDESFFEKNNNDDHINKDDSNNNHLNKPRVFRKCRRLLNRSGDANNITIRSDSKIVQMYNEKLLECRNKSNNDIESIRTACTVLKNFNTKPEQCRACILCKFSSNPSISHSCKCCDSNFKFKSKSVNKFSTLSTFPIEFTFDKFSKII